MFKRTVTMMLAAGTLVLGGCASNGGAEQAGVDKTATSVASPSTCAGR